MKKLLLVKLFFFVFFNLKSSEKFLEFLLTYDYQKIFTKEDIIKKIFESFLGTDDLSFHLKRESSDKNFIKFISLTEELTKFEINEIPDEMNKETNKKILNEIINLKNFFIDELGQKISNEYGFNLEEKKEEISLSSNIFSLSNSNNSTKTSIKIEYQNFLHFLNSFSDKNKLKIYLENFFNNPEETKNLTISDLNYLKNLTYEEFKNKYNNNPLLKLITKNYYPQYKSSNFTYFPEDFLSLKENKKYLIIDIFYRYYAQHFISESFPLSSKETDFYAFLSCNISKDFEAFLRSGKIQTILEKNKEKLILKGISPNSIEFQPYNILNIFEEIKNLKK